MMKYVMIMGRINGDEDSFVAHTMKKDFEEEKVALKNVRKSEARFESTQNYTQCKIYKFY